MKRIFITVAAFSILFSSCIGSFSLSKRLLSWNQTIDSKFVNALVFIGLTVIPVYPISLLADVLVINSIEFWSGENPLEAGVVKQVQGADGIYTVETLENGYHIQNEKGAEMNLIYDKESNIWSVVADGESTKLIKVEDENNAIVYMPNGEERSVELSQAGVLAFQQSLDNTTYYLAAK